MADAPSDSEWEYEYSSTETSTFYIPLDLSNVPSAQIPPAVVGRPGHPTLLKSRLRALNAQRGQPVEIPVAPVDGNEAPTMGQLQIVGLHTPEPLVMYNGQLLACEWNKTLGTDMFFTKPIVAVEGEEGELPLRKLPEVDLIASSGAKLIAREAMLRPKDEVIDEVDDEEMQDESGNAAASTAAGEALEGQQSFLDRLNQARAKRGVKTRLTWVDTAGGSRLVAEKVRGGHRGGRGGGRGVGRRSTSSPPSGDAITGGT